MHRFWDHVIEPLVGILKPEVIVEIGSDYGRNTEKLLAFSEEHGGTVHVVDPLPKYDTADWKERYGDTVVFHRDLSLNVLPKLEDFDLVLIDGDHNWYTVVNELRRIRERCEELAHSFPLVLFHDAGWPYGRRDLYYAPETIPDEYRQPYSVGGVLPEVSAIVPNGGLNRHLAHAVREGGARNGVLTAVEDFVHETQEDFELVLIPGLHGLGVLVPSSLRESNEELREFLDALVSEVGPSSLAARNIERVERARLDAEMRQQEYRALYDELHTRTRRETKRLQREAERSDKALQNTRENLAIRVQRLKALRARLKRETENTRQLTQWMEKLNQIIPALLESRPWKAAHTLERISRRASRQPRSPSTQDRLRWVLGQYRQWKKSSGAPESGGDPGSASSQPESEIDPASNTRERFVEPAISAQELAERTRKRLEAIPEQRVWPSVSIIILNRDGRPHLGRLFSGLRDQTDYPNLEIVLVDNGSTDDSVEFVGSLETGCPIKVVRNEHNKSFSEANNQGFEEASGELLLFLNNDTEPFESGWLKELVSSLSSSGAAAAGAYLLYPGGHGQQRDSGYEVQHRGIRFRRAAAGTPLAFNVGGEDALADYLGSDAACPAATAACLLIYGEAFRSVGGFSPGYRYGAEDVDLGLKLTRTGHRVISSGRSVILHREFGTQETEGRDFQRINRTHNRRLFLERWGPALDRELSLDRLGSEAFWSDKRAHVAITVTSNDPNDGYGDWYTGHEIGDALDKRGWRVSYVQQKGGDWYSLPGDVDYLLVLIDKYDISRVSGVTTVAWIRNWTDRWVERAWFEEFDVILASSSISKDIIEERTNKTVTSLFPIATNPERFRPEKPDPTYEADYVFTGNHWGEPRLAEMLDVTSGETFLIFGKDWENVPAVSRYARGPVPYDRLPKVYSSAKLVLDHTASPTLPYGAVNSRVFDALATGTLVVSNCEAGVRELFDEDFPTYDDGQSLREHLDVLLEDETRREELAERYRQKVLQEHTYDRRAEQLTELLRDRAESSSFCIKIGAPNREAAQTWGDLPYARAMRRQLEGRGHPCLIQTLDHWDGFEGLRYDVAIHLKGLTPYTPKPGQFNVLWNISHPEKLSPEECDKYDLVFVASERWAEHLEKQTTTPIITLQQATDPEIFFPEQDPAHVRDLVFVGNSRKVERRILRDLLPTTHDLAVWGGDWENLIDRKYVAGAHLPNDQVRKAYSSARIVLNDHWDDMREHGFVSNRIYDALACGALVISDHLPELEQNFGDAIVTYRTPGELQRLVEHYLASPREREHKGRRGRELVLAKHTFEHRMDVMLREIMQRLGENAPQRVKSSEGLG